MAPLSTATVTPTSMDLGPCQLIFNGVDIGASLKNVKFTLKYDKAELKADQYGSSALDRRVSGVHATVETELAEILNKTNVWKTVFPHANLVGAGTAIQVVSAMGDSDISHAKTLVLHPLSQGPTDKTHDVNIYLATADASASQVFGPTEQQALKVVFNCYLDFTTSPPRLAFYGDPATGLVNASAGSPAPGSNTGNGTITSVSVFNGFTKTETITAKIVGQTGGNAVYVYGSVSGPLFEGTLGASPASTLNVVTNVISFTVTQGSVEFAAGDLFTIATTAANYV
jgi:hypothetical protein